MHVTADMHETLASIVLSDPAGLGLACSVQPPPSAATPLSAPEAEAKLPTATMRTKRKAIAIVEKRDILPSRSRSWPSTEWSASVSFPSKSRYRQRAGGSVSPWRCDLVEPDPHTQRGRKRAHQLARAPAPVSAALGWQSLSPWWS